ncbi:MAG: DUF3467 domain-containing protein [Acidimicrobiales bacterium]
MTVYNPGFAYPPVANYGASDPGEYINAIQVRSSLWEVALDLLHSFALPGQEGSGPPQMGTRIVCRAVMSPQHAKALAIGLSRTVAAWEEKNGPLPDVEAALKNVVDMTEREEATNDSHPG